MKQLTVIPQPELVPGSPAGILADVELDYERGELRCAGPISLSDVKIVGPVNIIAYAIDKTP